ncbi:UNVERIFIED_CONTAM: hypothetical protein Sindi_2634400 [Sesamum indicum]
MVIMSAIIISSRFMRSSMVGFGFGNGNVSGGGDGDVKVRLETCASEPRPNTQPLFLPPTSTSHICCSITASEASGSAGASWSRPWIEADDPPSASRLLLQNKQNY